MGWDDAREAASGEVNAGDWEEMDGESSGGGVAGEDSGDSRGSNKSSPLSSKRGMGDSSSSLKLESIKNTVVTIVIKCFIHTVIFLRKAEKVAVKVLNITYYNVE